ncbi:protein kinase [Algibacter amylolyticus]|uniref:Protein kinase n=1 Tax=Algibacter amylolyticus TaxID=1608400 RepID=A0A5M7AV44_9FLAO|nr:protein kinase [Algibacter amylolyticus]KAA5820560.1 protein kinase [Algibacter amylolyticus]MBB5269981.1 serine/threonine protein kinase [Algibacter amylolyticus]TSJ71233.1 protein kinase [Algibacter amylolyticus]
MYKLSSYIELSSEKDKNQELEYFALISTKRTKVFLINETIFNFLKHFEMPNTLTDVFKNYKAEFKLEKSEEVNLLKGQLESFFNDLAKRHWIVPEDKIEELPELDTLFKEKDTFLNYKVLSVLGNNKITDVYLVRDLKTNKKLVVKLLNKSKFKDEKSFDKYSTYFEEEFNFANKFNSIYINKTLGFKSYKEQPYFLLKPIEGVSISKYVNNNKLKTPEKVKLILKMLRGFSIVHQNKVYHGDIHFSNVMVQKSGVPVIIDFGYANNVEVNIENAQEKVRNGGVYAFIPPERALRSLDRRFSKVTHFQAEVYQIGIIIYYIFIKELPFKADTWKTMVDEKQQLNLGENEVFLKRKIPKQVKKFIIKCLEPNPENRFSSATAMYNNWKAITKKLN